MPNKNKGGKQAIINDVMAKGFSARKAKKAVDAVFALMTEALSYWESVDIPGVGTLQVKIQQGTEMPKRRVQKTQNIQTKKIESRTITFPGWRRVMKLKPDPKLKLPASPVPPVAVQPPSSPDKIPADRPLAKIGHAYRGGRQPLKVPARVRRNF